MSNPPRLRRILESSTMDRRTLTETMLKARPQGAPAADAPLDPSTRESAERAFAKFGKPALAPNATWADAYEALTGDVDGDGAADFDIDAAMLARMWAPTPEGTRFERTVVAGGDGEVRLEDNELIVGLRLMRKEKFSPLPAEVPTKSWTIADARLQTNGVLYFGVHPVKAAYPLRLPGLPVEVGNALIDRLLEAEVPADSPLAPALEQLAAQKAFHLRAQAPSDPGEAVAWRASHLDSSRLDAMTAQLTERYGVRPLRFTGYVDELKDAPLAKVVLEAARPQNGITPAFLFTIAEGEGMRDRQDVNEAIGGYGALGLDTFGTRVADLKRRLLLPESFTEGVDYMPREEKNEKGESVTSADFPDVKRGLMALNAMLADDRRRFLSDARAVLGPEQTRALTQDQLNYFTYVYFNAGAGFGRQHLESRGLQAAEKWEGEPPANNRVARYNALQRVSTWRLIDATGIFG